MWRRIQHGHMAKEATLGLMLKDYMVKMMKYPFKKKPKKNTVIWHSNYPSGLTVFGPCLLGENGSKCLSEMKKYQIYTTLLTSFVKPVL